MTLDVASKSKQLSGAMERPALTELRSLLLREGEGISRSLKEAKDTISTAMTLIYRDDTERAFERWLDTPEGTFGFGLSKGEDDYGRQLAGLVEERFAGAITLVREGSSCPTARELLTHPNITFWGDLDVAGIEILQRLRRAVPGLRFSALYQPMLEALEGQAGSHPYVSSVGKPGQHNRHTTVRCDDKNTEKLISRCAMRGVDQECVQPMQIEQHAAYELVLDE